MDSETSSDEVNFGVRGWKERYHRAMFFKDLTKRPTTCVSGGSGEVKGTATHTEEAKDVELPKKEQQNILKRYVGLRDHRMRTAILRCSGN